MALKYSGTNVSSVTYNNATVNKVNYNDITTWCRQFTYTTGTLPTGVASLTCTRYSSDNPGTSTGTVSNSGAIFYDDKLYWSATAATGYNVSLTYTGTSSLYTVKGNVTGVSTSGVSASVKSYTLSLVNNMTHGTLTCYRQSSPLQGAATGSSATLTNGSTIYHGDTIYVKATPTTGYDTPTITSNTGLTFTNYISSAVDGYETISIGDNGSVPSYTLTLDKQWATGANVTCYRYSSPLQGAATGSSATLVNGSAIYSNDTIYCSATATTGYNAPTITSSTGLTFVNNISSAINGNEIIKIVAEPKSYTLTIQTDYSSGLSPTTTCYRYDSEKEGALDNSTLSNGSTIYHYDEIRANISVSGGAAGVTSTTGTMMYVVPGNEYSLFADGNETIKFVARKAYTLTLNKSREFAFGYACYRYSSQVPGVPIGSTAAPLSNGSTIYEGDVIYVMAQAETAFEDPTITSSTGTISSGYLTVDGNETITITGGDVLHYTLTLNVGNSEMANIICYRTYKIDSQGNFNPEATSGYTQQQENISNGSTIYHGDSISIGIGASVAGTGYSGTSIIVSPNATLINDTTNLDQGKKVASVGGDVTINVGHQPTQYTLTIPSYSGATLTCYRYSTKRFVSHGGGTFSSVSTGSSATLANNSAIYYGDVIYVTPTPDQGYGAGVSCSTGTISSNKLTVDGNETINVVTRDAYTLQRTTVATGISSIVCYRKSSEIPGVYTGGVNGQLGNLSEIYAGDVIYFSATAATGYNNPTVSSADGTLSSNQLTVDGDEQLFATAGSVKSYSLTLNTTYCGGSTITCYRNSSPLKGASTGSGATLSNGSTIYHGDTIYCKITLSDSSYYSNPTVTSSTGLTFTNYISDGVNGNETIKCTTTPNSYTLTFTPDYGPDVSGGTIILKRYSTKKEGESTGDLSYNHSGQTYITVYYDDVIECSATPPSGSLVERSSSTGSFLSNKMTVNGDEIITLTFRKGRTLTLNTGNNVSSVTCYRSSSECGASTGSSATLSNGSTIYDGDKIYVSASVLGGSPYTYNVGSNTGLSFSSGTSSKVDGNETISVSRVVKSYKLTLLGISATGVSNYTCYRNSSPYQGASTGSGAGSLSNNSTIYYGDTIYFSATASSGYSVTTDSTTGMTKSENVFSSVDENETLRVTATQAELPYLTPPVVEAHASYVSITNNNNIIVTVSTSSRIEYTDLQSGIDETIYFDSGVTINANSYNEYSFSTNDASTYDYTIIITANGYQNATTTGTYTYDPSSGS